MLIVETIAKIRRYHFVEGKKIKQIVRDLRISRNTVRKVLRSGATEHHYERDTQPLPKLGPFAERLEALLEEDAKRPRNGRMTAQRLFEVLQSEGYQGAYDSVERTVKKWRQQRGRAAEQVFIPLTFALGEAYQFDWSHEKVILAGMIQIVKVAHFRLCHNRMFFVVAYPRESQEMVFDAHNKAFAFFDGACRRGIYDNLKTAVDRVLLGKQRKFNQRFLHLCSHYLVEPVTCTPGSGWEKGQVENQVRNVRNWLFTPRSRFKGFAELNGWLTDQCLLLAKKRAHPEDKPRTIWEVFEQERQHLIATPHPFHGYVDTECRVSSTSLVRYGRNHYSVDSTLAGRTAIVRAHADRIVVISNGACVADHPRQFGRDKVIYDPWHYLGVLERKPGALRNGAPFQEWDLPVNLRRVLAALAQRTGGDREFVELLLAAQRVGVAVVEQACEQALNNGTLRSEIILNSIARGLNPAPVASVSVPAALLLSVEPIADCARYDALRQEVPHATP